MKEVFEPVTKPTTDVTRDVTKTAKVTSEENIEAIAALNDKVKELMKDPGITASYLVSPLSKSASPEQTGQFKLVKDLDSTTVNDLLLNKTIPHILYDNFLTFRDTDKKLN